MVVKIVTKYTVVSSILPDWYEICVRQVLLSAADIYSKYPAEQYEPWLPGG